MGGTHPTPWRRGDGWDDEIVDADGATVMVDRGMGWTFSPAIRDRIVAAVNAHAALTAEVARLRSMLDAREAMLRLLGGPGDRTGDRPPSPGD